MYPNLYYAFQDLFGLDWKFLKLVNTFGFFVAICFLVSAMVVTFELRRKQQIGLLSYTEEKIMVGAPASYIDLFVNFLFGFVFGYKILGAFIIPDVLNDPQTFMLSTNGHLPLGILVGLVFCSIKWWEKNKEKLAKPEQRIIRIWPHDRVGDLVMYAAIFGFAGAKIFHNLENWDDFVKNPIEALKSFSGLTFYGGLICAGTAIILYARKEKIAIVHLADAFAPALMIGYAIGRIGCHISGDGDWGILNSHYVSTTTGQIAIAQGTDYTKALGHNFDFYASQFKNLELVRHIDIKPFWHLPDWLFAYNYPHNVISEGSRIVGCSSTQYCNQLPIPVFPTALYEVVICFFLFFVLWSLRKKLKVPGQITAIYLFLNGFERFFIEKIRVNTRYENLPFQPTQAELISSILIITGIILFIKVTTKKAVTTI
jgi:prolipoprotein diacylglyceryl transferase